MITRHRFLASTLAIASVAPTLVVAQSLVPLRIGSAASETFGEAYFTQAGGFFKAAGIEPTITSFANGAATAAALAGGSIDVGIGEATELANGIARGLPFGIFAGCALYTSAAPTTLLVVANTSNISGPKDFEWQTIAVPSLVSLSCTAVKAWLVQGGADLNSVRFVELTIAQMGVAVAHGTVAGAHIGEPALSAASDVKGIAKPYDAVGKQFLISDWFSTRDWLAKNAPLAKRLVDAIYASARWSNDHHDLTAPVLAQVAKLELERVKAMRRTRFATTLTAGLVQPVLDAAATYKALVRPMKAEELIVTVG